jgi:ribosomal-protein-serine acetyltransferase
MKRFYLSGKSRELRELALEDADELFALVDANREHLRQWLPWLDRNTSAEDSSAFIESTLEQHQAGKGFVCAVLERGRIVGTCGFHPIEAGDDLATIGYWLAADATGKGLIIKSVTVLLEHAFGPMGLRRVEIPVATGNWKSQAVCRRLGLNEGGIRPSAEDLYGVYVDHLVFYIDADEWKAGNRRP